VTCTYDVFEKTFDAAIGLYNYGYRDYQPEVARFTTIDPIRDGANWFAYVNNDPVNWVDLWGLEDVYYYEENRSSTNTLYGHTSYSYTHYSDNKETLDQYREAQIAVTARDTNYKQSKDNPGVFTNNAGPSLYSNAMSIGYISYGEIKEGNLPDGLPSPSMNNPVITVNGTAKDNNIGCQH
jgi:RHS repeat-associated protein